MDSGQTKKVESKGENRPPTPIPLKGGLQRTPPPKSPSVSFFTPLKDTPEVLVAGNSRQKPPPKGPKQKPSLFGMMMVNDRGELSSLEYADKLVNDMAAYAATRSNVHGELRTMLTKLQRVMLELNKDWDIREETIRKKATEPEETVAPRTSFKRVRNSSESPPMTPALKVPRNGKEQKIPSPKVPLQGDQRQGMDEEEGWEIAGRKKKKIRKAKPMPEKKPQPRNARKVRPKSDALVIEAKDENSYADILRKVKSDPTLKELGDQVARIRRTKKGEMLFELKGDSLVKSVTFKELMGKVLGESAAVRALTQETVVEVNNLDEITTEEELREALIEQFSLGDIGSTAKVKMRKAYGGTQIGTIKLPMAEANKLLEAGKIKVGWTICQLRAPRTQLLRCYRCLGFGHVASGCKLTDRSKSCWKCGEDGHVSKTCTNKPNCVLCQKDGENNHVTGSLKCNAYKTAKARQGWR
jgi:Zinc knuckle